MKISSNWSAPVKQSGHFSVKIGRKTKTLRCSLSPVLCVWLNWNIQVAKTERPRRERNHLSVPPCLPKWKRVKRKTSFPPCGQRSFKKTLCDTCTATSNSAAVSWTLVWVQNQNAKREKSPWGRQGERGRTGRTFFYLFSVTESTQPLWSDTLQTLHRHTHTHTGLNCYTCENPHWHGVSSSSWDWGSFEVIVAPVHYTTVSTCY